MYHLNVPLLCLIASIDGEPGVLWRNFQFSEIMYPVFLPLAHILSPYLKFDMRFIMVCVKTILQLVELLKLAHRVHPIEKKATIKV